MQRASGRHGGGRGLPAEDRYLRMLLYAPGCTGKAGEPVGGMTKLRMQMYSMSRYVPGLGAGPGRRGFGEFCRAIDAAYGRCAESGLAADGGGIRLTPRGMEDAEALWGEADDDARETVADTKEFLNDMGRWELASFVRTAYPEAAGEPGIACMPEGERLGAAASLVTRHKVTAARGAEIAGMATEDFVAELRKRGHEPYYTDMETLDESMKVIDSLTGR